MLIVILDQTIGIFAHLEEVAVFFDKFDFVPGRSLAADHLAVFITINFGQFGKVFFIRNGVPALVFSKIDIAFFKQFFKNLLNCFDVVIIRRANKLIIADFKLFPKFLD